MSDEPKKSKKPVVIIAVVLLLCALVAAGLFLNSRRAKIPNLPPIAALSLDSIDETNRVAILSDGGSHDPDGTVQSWRIDWGDGKEETLSSMPQKQAHTYAAEGEYSISLWCFDNLGATSSPPAMTNITFDLLKRQKAAEMAAEARRQAEAKAEAERLKAEEARKEAERLEAERKNQMAVAAAALAAQQAREQQEMEARRKAEAELAQQKAQEPAPPPPIPLGAALPDDSSARRVVYTPPQYTIGEFQISKEGTEGKGNDGNLLVVLITRCVNFPDTGIATSDWQIDGKDTHVQSSRIRASLSPGRHQVTARFSPKSGSQPREIKADVTVDTTGECVVTPMR
jgi:hypothetical protein